MAESDVRETSQAGVFELQVQLTAETWVNASDVTATARDIDKLLRELERRIDPNNKHRATWKWAQPDPSLQFTASPNGASADTLMHVVSAAQDGFASAKVAAEGTGATEWPSEFSPAARKLASNILERLQRLTSIVVSATGKEPIEIEEARTGDIVRGTPSPRRVRSSVDGVLRVLTGGEKVVWAGLREHRTNAYVRCTFDAAEWRATLGPLWEKRVVVDGMVAYDENHRPKSIIDIRRVVPRDGPINLARFGGAVPGLTGGLTDDEFVRLIRRDD